MPSPLRVSMAFPLLFPYKDTFLIGFGANLGIPGSHLEILDLITPAKTLFPRKVTLRGSGGQKVDMSFEGPPFYSLQVGCLFAHLRGGSDEKEHDPADTPMSHGKQ